MVSFHNTSWNLNVLVDFVRIINQTDYYQKILFDAYSLDIVIRKTKYTLESYSETILHPQFKS